MKIFACVGYPDDELESYRPSGSNVKWELAISGFWSEDIYHSGYIAYFVHRTHQGIWIMNGIERNAELDDVTEADIEEGLLNDDQIQAMWGMTLEEAQNQTYERIVSVLLDAPEGLSSTEAAKHLYAAVQEADGKIIDEPDTGGLLESS